MTGPFPLIEIEGPPLARGRSYGRQAGDRIARGLDLYAKDFDRLGVDVRAAAKRYLSVLERFDAELSAEVRGIAEGAEQPVELIVALNARTELTAWDAAAALAPDECTAALAMPERTADGSLLHGQNWDWRPDCAASSIVLLVRSVTGPDILTFCEAGQLARHGFNSVGIALTANGLQTDRENAPGGIPSPFARRRMLMAATLADAIGTVLNTPRSASHNLLLSHAGARGRSEAVNFETTPEEVFWSYPDQGLFTHGNHFKHPTALMKVRDIGLLRHPESLYRDKRVLDHLVAGGDRITMQTFADAFADDYGSPHAVCRRPAARADGSVSATVASLIMSAGTGQMWLAPSPYQGADFTEYRLAR